MLSIGISSPVTKFSAGRMYHKELARQLADVLHTHNILHKMGGMATITDIYCIYNRMRSMELVSPDDLLQAVHEIQNLRLGFCLRIFLTVGWSFFFSRNTWMTR